MIRNGLFIFFIILSVNISLQAQKNYRAIDKRAIETPEADMRSITQLAAYLAASAKDDLEKARAIYTWMTHHITYSDTTVHNGWLGTPKNKWQQQAEQVLKNRTAVCEGFANLYKALCDAVGLPAELVTGVVKEEDGTVADVGHAWNAVQIEGQWYLSDPTWGSGYADYWTRRFVREYQEAFFLVPAEKMIQSHLPDDPIWQLLPNPLTDQEFCNLSAVPLSARVREIPTQPFVYQDSIQRWFQQDSLQRILSASERILHYNPKNALALARLSNHFYNQAVRIYYNSEEQILESLDDSNKPLDTIQLFSQLDNAEILLQKSRYYDSQVEDEKLLEDATQEELLRAELDYLRGLVQVWKVIKRYDILDGSSKNASDAFYAAMYADAQIAQQYFSNAELVYARQTADLYKKALDQVKLHKALLYNYLAKADGMILDLSDEMSEAELAALAARLDRGEATYQKMLELVQAVLAGDSMSLMGRSFMEEYPLIKANFFTDRGYVYQFSLHKKYQRQWDNPDLLNKKMADEMITAYLKCNDFAQTAADFLKKVPKGENLDAMNRQLQTLRSNTFICVGDIKRNHLVNDWNSSIKKPAEFSVQKKNLLEASNKVLEYYSQALKLTGDNVNTKTYLIESIDQVREMQQQLEK